MALRNGQRIKSFRGSDRFTLLAILFTAGVEILSSSVHLAPAAEVVLIDPLQALVNDRSRDCHFSIFLKVPVAFDELIREVTVLCQRTFTPTDVFVPCVARPSLRGDANTDCWV
jgi:hypothetical protein